MNDAEHFQKAIKVPQSEYTGWCCLPGSDAENAHREPSEALEAWEDDREEGEQRPTFLWAVVEKPLLRRHQIWSLCWDEMLDEDDSTEGIIFQGLPELNAALDAFMAANADLKVLRVDYTRAIILESETTKNHETA